MYEQEITKHINNLEDLRDFLNTAKNNKGNEFRHNQIGYDLLITGVDYLSLNLEQIKALPEG